MPHLRSQMEAAPAEGDRLPTGLPFLLLRFAASFPGVRTARQEPSRGKAFDPPLDHQSFRKAMPRFFFHVRCRGETLSYDDMGLDFTDAVTAHNEAVRAARGLDGAFVTRGRNPHDCAIEVEDDTGELVFSVSFAAIFNGHAKPFDPHI